MKIVLLILVLAVFLSGCSFGTYNAKTAEEWYYDYSSLKDDAERAQNTRNCVEKTRNLYKDVIGQMNSQELLQAANSGGLTKALAELDKAKVDCYSKYFE